MRTYLIWLVKVLVSAISLWWVAKKIKWSLVYSLLGSIHLMWLLAALVVFTISRFIAAARLNLFFHHVGLKLPHWLNVQLYYVGMFYNFCLPGGISGDGYKIYWLQRHYKVAVNDLIHATFADRLSGLVALVWLFFVCFLGCKEVVATPWLTTYCLCAVVCLWPVVYVVQYFWGSRFLPIFLMSNIQALLMQTTQVVVVYFLLCAMHVKTSLYSYLCVFLLSSVAAVIPLSIAGVGAREMTFLYLQPLFGYDETVGVALSSLFFFLSLVATLPGMFCALPQKSS